MARTDPNIEALKEMPRWGTYLYKAFKIMMKQVSNVASQSNTALNSSENAAPPPVNELRVTAGGGVVHLQAVHNENFYRGITYHFHASSDSGFSSPVTLYSGPNRDVRIPVGNSPLHYAVTCDYGSSSPSSPVTYYTNGGSVPVSVAATGSSQPVIPAGQGSGTGYPGQLAGYGPQPWRGTSPPRRI